MRINLEGASRASLLVAVACGGAVAGLLAGRALCREARRQRRAWYQRVLGSLGSLALVVAAVWWWLVT